MKKIMLFNGSPRKDRNTATLLKHAAEGAAAQGAGTELVHLYGLDYKGCISCFACKEKGGKNYGRCAVRDELSPVLERVRECGGIVLGSPVYLASVSGAMQSFLERLIFPYIKYTQPPGSLFPGKIPAGFIFTMGITEQGMKEAGYEHRFAAIERLLRIIFGTGETLLSFDTCQFDDYSRFVAPRFDPAEKLKRRDEVFPLDCRKAYKMGARIAGAGGKDGE